MTNIYLLGCTGSIGIQTLEVIRTLKDVSVRSMSFGTNIDKAIPLIKEFKPDYVCAINRGDALKIKALFPRIEVGFGDEGLVKAATFDSSSDGFLINAVVGMIGLKPTIEAIKINRSVLLANKETLVVGGELIKKELAKSKAKLIPIDSEHSAIMQCLEGRNKEEVSELIITASGGAFRNKTRDELKDVTIVDALNHPNWVMGKKITVDCATMVNKGLEVMEAHYLFDMPYSKIKTILHFESIVHSMVKYNDGSVIAQMAKPDMRIPIQNAITYPNKLEYVLDDSINMEDIPPLTFRKMDMNRYPCLHLAYRVANMGGIMPLVFNSSNEEAVKLFIDNKIKFLDIEKILFASVKEYEGKNIFDYTLDDILRLNEEIREFVRNNYRKIIL